MKSLSQNVEGEGSFFKRIKIFLFPDVDFKAVLGSRYLKLYLIAFLFYYLVWAVYNYNLQPDTGMYVQMGRGIFEQFTFGYRGRGGLFYPMAFRMPFAAFFIGLFYFFTKEFHYTCFCLITR